MSVKEAENICFYCHGRELPMIKPCDCKNSYQYVHEECVANWITAQPPFFEPICKDCDGRMNTVRSNQCTSAILTILLHAILLPLRFRSILECVLVWLFFGTYEWQLLQYFQDYGLMTFLVSVGLAILSKESFDVVTVKPRQLMYRAIEWSKSLQRIRVLSRDS